MRTRKILFLIVICLALFSIAQISAAQSSADCPAIAEQAFEAVANNCAIPERSSTCYGFPGVTATGFDAEALANFSEPSDRANLTEVSSIHTSPLNVAEGEWGMAVTNIQANLPVGMPGQGGVFISMGDVTVTNGVAPDDALILPESALPLTTTAPADIYNVPPDFGTAQEVIGATASGTTLQADGLSEDGEWVRVFFTAQTTLALSSTGWVELTAFPDDVDLTSLPTISADSMTPMQKFYLTNGIETPACAEIVPSMLYVQGPEEIELDFVANDVPIRVSSTAILRVIPPGNILQIIALSGIIIIDPDSGEPIILAPGFTSIIALGELQDLNGDGIANERAPLPGASWSQPGLMDASELEALADALNENIPENLQYYEVGVPILVCASGVGEPVCEVQQPASSARVTELCALGVLPPELCGS